MSYMVVDVIGIAFRTFKLLRKEAGLEPVRFPDDCFVHDTGPICLPNNFPLRRYLPEESEGT